MKRITILTGHYGSGKSEFSLNLALTKKVDYLIDLDIINPYFRSREKESLLTSSGIQLLGPGMENALGSDLPYVSASMYIPFRNKTKSAIIDLGGDIAGAKLLRQFSEEDLSEVDLLCCINIYRPETASVDLIISLISHLEIESGMSVTGLVNTSNLLRETTCDDILDGERILKKVSAILNLAIKYTAVIDQLSSKCDITEGEVVPIKMYLRQNWL